MQDNISSLNDLPEDYQVVKFLSRGIIRDVILAIEKSSGAQMVVHKYYKTHLNVNSFKQFAKTHKLKHPHLSSRLKNLYEEKLYCCIFYEYYPNGSLLNYLKKKKKFTEEEAFVFFIQSSFAINYLHQKETFHGSLQSKNILIDEFGNAVLKEFGSYKTIALKQQDDMILNFNYISPEELYIVQDEQVDYKLVDIWALGILLYELIHGKTPFHNNSIAVFINNIQNCVFQGFECSDDCTNLIKGLLKANPKERIGLLDIFTHPWCTNIATQLGLQLDDYI